MPVAITWGGSTAVHFFLREQERSEAFPDEHEKKSFKGCVEKIKKSFLF